MPVNTNTSWFDVTLLSKYFTNQNTYFCLDDPEMARPAGVTQFIGIQAEPMVISGLRDRFIKNHSNYDIFLAHDDEILKACPKAKLYVFGSCWISPIIYNSIDIARKLPRISSLTGWKDTTDGHNFRRHLYFNQKSIDLPITWYRSCVNVWMIEEITSNPILDVSQFSKKDLFLDYQYSLVIENNRTPNYFTEKLLDCLMTKTIPIYWGCTNIDTWFDTTGWIILETTDMNELIEKCKVLPVYSENLETIHKNYESAKKYICLEKNITDSLGLTSTS